MQEEVPVLLVQEVDQEEARHHIKMLPVELELPVAQEDPHQAPEGAIQKDLLLQEKVAHHLHLEVDPQALEAQHLEEEEVEILECQLGLKQAMVPLAAHREERKEAL